VSSANLLSTYVDNDPHGAELLPKIQIKYNFSTARRLLTRWLNYRKEASLASLRGLTLDTWIAETLDTLRRRNQCSTCTRLCTKFVQLLYKNFGEVSENDYQRIIQVGAVYGRFEPGLIRTSLSLSLAVCIC
jgi:hypothetical protein